MSTAPTLVEALSKGVQNKSGRSCLLSNIQDQLSDEEREALDKAIELVLADKNTGQRKAYSTAWLVRVLNSQGHSISPSTLQRHMKKLCSCFAAESAVAY